MMIRTNADKVILVSLGNAFDDCYDMSYLTPIISCIPEPRTVHSLIVHCSDFLIRFIDTEC